MTCQEQPGADLRERARGCLVGLGVGDALGAPAENLSAAEISARWGEVTDFLDDRSTGTDDTEYACLIGLLLVQTGGRLDHELLVAHYRQHVLPLPVLRGAGFSELGTAENLRRGWLPPVSGQHAHPGSDGVAMRAAVHGIAAAGDPGRARELCRIDAEVSAGGEGIWAGQYVADLVARVLVGEPVPIAVDAARAALPADSWTAASLSVAVSLDDEPAELLERLVCKRFPWTDLAPEAIAIATWCLLQHPNSYAAAVTRAVSLGRDADTTAAITGAVLGAALGLSAIPQPWRDRLGPVTGRCLGPVVAGTRLEELADGLIELSGHTVSAGGPQ